MSKREGIRPMREAGGLSKLLKIILYSVSVWIITLGLSFIIPVPIVSGFAGLLSLLVSFVLLILAFITLIKDKDKISSVLAILLIVVTAWLAVTRGLEWGAHIHFRLFR